MSARANPASTGGLLVCGGFREPVIIRHVSFSVASSLFAWWSVLTPGKHTMQLSNVALEQTTRVWLEWLPILGFFVCGWCCFLFRLSFWSSRYVLCMTTFGPVWRQDTQGGCSRLSSHRSSWCLAVCHIHDSAGGRGWLVSLSDTRGAGLWCSTPTDRLERRSVFLRLVPSPYSAYWQQDRLHTQSCAYPGG